MQSANVLRIYELIMSKYDKLLPIYLSAVEDNNLDEIKQKLETLTNSIESAPTCAAVEDEVVAFGDHNVLAKITDASGAAFDMASEQMKDESDCEEYKKGFRLAYDAALRVELYRQFLAKGQNFNDLVLQFIKKKGIALKNTKSLIDFLFEEISTNIDSEFSKFQKAQGSMSHTGCLKVILIQEGLNKLLVNFKQKISHLSTSPLNPTNKVAIQNASLDFQIAAGQLIRGYQLKNESNESWAPFLKNMLMLITGIGAIPAISSLVIKAVTGHYAFFDKPVVRNTTSEEMAPEDKLLGTVSPAT